MQQGAAVIGSTTAARRALESIDRRSSGIPGSRSIIPRTPVFARLEGLDDRVTGRVEMLPCVADLRPCRLLRFIAASPAASSLGIAAQKQHSSTSPFLNDPGSCASGGP